MDNYNDLFTCATYTNYDTITSICMVKINLDGLAVIGLVAQIPYELPCP